jgi:hypothetical protein
VHQLLADIFNMGTQTGSTRILQLPRRALTQCLSSASRQADFYATSRGHPLVKTSFTVHELEAKLLFSFHLRGRSVYYKHSDNES